MKLKGQDIAHDDAKGTARDIALAYAQRVWDYRDLAVIDELLHPDCVIHSLLGDFHGPASMKEVVQAWLIGFPDLVVNNSSIVTENDLVAIQWQAKGSHQGEFKGIPPTGKPVAYAGVTLYRVRHAKIVEYWAYIDMQHLLKQISSREFASKVLIRPLIEADIPQIVTRYCFPWSTPEKTKTLWNTYYHEQQEGIRTVAVLEEKREIVGYGSLLRRSECPFFAEANIPEINAIWIDEDHRRQGLGTALIKWMESLAQQEGYHQIGLGVGLYKDYGPAQKLYCRLGYTPDGNGITYKGQLTTPGQTYPLDDDLLV